MHIAVVDPSRTVLKCIRVLLEARDHHVYPFTDGAAALQHIEADPNIDAAIISAEQASGAGAGIELCWQTRLLASSYRPIYVILMSAHDGRQTLIEALDSGADDFIAKPPLAEELYARLRAAERVNSMQRDLIRLATTDPLTGVLNRRAFFERAQPMCDRAHCGFPLSAVMMDIDHFKRINDRHGHALGDEVIRCVAGRAAEEDRLVGRLGGEEFAVLLEADIHCAHEVAEQLRIGIARMQFKTVDGTLGVTCSLGVSDWQPSDNVDELLRRADIALYSAKSNGRNQVVADHVGLWVPNYDQRPTTIRAPARTASR
jgi:diguanylate cyclase (GGDEF)-like protein